RGMRILATGMLVAMAALFFLANHLDETHPAWAYVKAFSEAAEVGGLADWFAVTALFRHPLGLPIPHTAILPRSKDRIGAGLGDFVERNFLAPEIIAERLRSLALSRRFARWLAAPENARLAANQLAGALPYVVRSLGDPTLQEFVARSFGDQLREMDLAPVLGRLIALFTASEHYDVLFDRALEAARRMLAVNADRVYVAV